MSSKSRLTERRRFADLEHLERDLPVPGQTSFTRQQSPLGLGHAVWCARDIVGEEPFALLLPDVLVQAERGCLGQMMDAYREINEPANVIAVEEMAPERLHEYGVVGTGRQVGKAFEITSMVEKPARGKAPSNLIITGRYILQPEIFHLLETQSWGMGGEIQLTDAMIRLALNQPFYGVKFEGRAFDCGSKTGFLVANIAYALARPDIGPKLRPQLEEILRE